MLAAKVVRPVQDRPRVTLKCRCIDKPGRGVSRLIANGNPFDEATAAPPAPRLPSLRDIEAVVLRYVCAAVRDFWGWFYQLPVGPRVQQGLGLRVRRGGQTRYFVFEVAVPGIARACAMAQLVSGGITRAAGVQHQSLILYDDVLLAGSSEEDAAAACARFDTECGRARAVLKDDKCKPPSPVVQFDGLILDFRAKTIALPSEWIAKLAARPLPVSVTARELSHYLGCWRRITYVMQTPAASDSALVLFAQAVGRACSADEALWDAVVSVPDGVRSALQRVWASLPALRPRSLSVPRVSLHLWTDSSLVGAAVILLYPAERVCFLAHSWRWEDVDARLAPDHPGPPPVRRLELIAMLVGIHLACDVVAQASLSAVSLVALHDNSTAESRHRKLASPLPYENALLAAAWQRQARSTVVEVLTRLVPSSSQLADVATRENPFF
eukprot:TRINITY_DN1887_c1_g1_i4.p1 TRINITY_DN1887_c1_g1~~TRINITY_DN1887_c1_g1_i4.p1  ORF type:complete len:441 (+),score=19.01 TRINITY_DN1887_c1_g1_i4:1668-2990(+)